MLKVPVQRQSVNAESLFHCRLKANSRQGLNIDASLLEFQARYISPAMVNLANDIDQVAMRSLFNPEMSYQQFMLKAAKRIGKTSFHA